MVYKVRGPADYYKPGDWNADCSISGFKRKASELVRNWQGQWRIPEFNEPRQPQDFVRGVQDIQAVDWSQQPRAIYAEVCTYNGCAAVCGVGTVGCMTCGRYAWDMDFYPPIPPRPYLIDDQGNYILDPQTNNPIIVPLPTTPPPAVVAGGFTADSTSITADSDDTVS